MSSTIFEYPSDKGIVRVEANENLSQGPVAVGRGQNVVEKVKSSFDDAISGIQPIAISLVAQIEKIPTTPKSAEVKFGITLSGELGAILAKTSAEANIEITLTWEQST